MNWSAEVVQSSQRSRSGPVSFPVLIAPQELGDKFSLQVHQATFLTISASRACSQPQSIILSSYGAYVSKPCPSGFDVSASYQTVRG